MDCLIVGCGLCGMVAARTLAEQGFHILIVDKRPHIGGNTYDYYNEDGVLCQKYGPHSFFTEKPEIREYVERFCETVDCFVKCNTLIDGKEIPMPFNFQSIDILYPPNKAEILKRKLKNNFQNQEIVFVTDLLNSEDNDIREYGEFMYQNEYRLYTAKQWGRSIESVSKTIFNRVPVYLSYKDIYQKHSHQFVPVGGFTKLSSRILDHNNINVLLNTNALDHLCFGQNGALFWNEKEIRCPVLYTGSIDELFNYKYGLLQYRSLEFIWKTVNKKSVQSTAIVAYPQAEKVTRITEYTRLPAQTFEGGVISIEIPFQYNPNTPFGNEPYYPIVSEEARKVYRQYLEECDKYPNLFLGGRLGEYRYYNMDDVIIRAKEICKEILKILL